ncbi:MAG: hypothetical protein ABJG68_15545 [Crocinitomicaceae bacterium]
MIFCVKYFVPKGYRAITIWPFIFVKTSAVKENKRLINHEKIHIRQQLELLVLPFYLWYAVEFLVHLIRLKNRKKAYHAISFEREAHEMDADFNYLKNRRFWNFLTFFS